MTNEKPLKKDKLSEDEVITVIDMFKDLMNAYGSFAESLGRIQKEHEEAYQEMFSLETAERLPKLLSRIMVEDPDLAQLVVTILAKMSSFLPMISNIMDLSADEKIRLGKNLKSLAEDFESLRKRIKEAE